MSATKNRPGESSGAVSTVQESTDLAPDSTGPVLALPGVVDVSWVDPVDVADLERFSPGWRGRGTVTGSPAGGSS